MKKKLKFLYFLLIIITINCFNVYAKENVKISTYSIATKSNTDFMKVITILNKYPKVLKLVNVETGDKIENISNLIPAKNSGIYIEYGSLPEIVQIVEIKDGIYYTYGFYNKRHNIFIDGKEGIEDLYKKANKNYKKPLQNIVCAIKNDNIFQKDVPTEEEYKFLKSIMGIVIEK